MTTLMTRRLGGALLALTLGLPVLAAGPALALESGDVIAGHAPWKTLSIWLVALVTIAFAARYTYQIWKGEISPTLSTWIIFLLGTGLSLTTYAIAEQRDFASGILNTMDVVAVLVILIATIVWGQRAVRFKPFEKWYLPPGQRLLANDTIDVAYCLHHDGIKGVYEPEKLLSLAASIANAGSRPADGQAPEPKVIALTQRTSTGGHTSPSIMFPSYFMPSIEAKALLEARQRRQAASGKVIPARLEITPEWFYAKNASKAVNHQMRDAHEAIDTAPK